MSNDKEVRVGDVCNYRGCKNKPSLPLLSKYCHEHAIPCLAADWRKEKKRADTLLDENKRLREALLTNNDSKLLAFEKSLDILAKSSGLLSPRQFILDKIEEEIAALNKGEKG